MILNNLISKLSSNLLLAVIGILFGAVVLLAIDNYFTSSSLDSTKKDLTKKEVELKDTKEAFNTAVKEYAKELELEKNKAAYQATTLKEIEQVIKATSKVKQEEIKRGVIKDEKDSNFIITKF